jgi:hypothetical protein
MTDEDQDEAGAQVEYTTIVVGKRPLVIYDWTHRRGQDRFLDGIDPDFFRYVAAAHEAQLGGDHDAQAAVALRLAYAHALETLFALIGAAIQAPHCPAGWVLNYRTGDLRTLVKTISHSPIGEIREPVISTWLPEHADWYCVTNTLIPRLPDLDETDALRAASARLWAGLARDLNDDDLHDEYNSLKHGFRVRSGEWFIKMGIEDVRGVAPPPEKMRLMGSSQYGSDFLRSVKLAEGQAEQRVVEDQRVNWNPAVLAKRIPLIADSIHNVLNALRAFRGRRRDGLEFHLFTGVDVAEALHDPSLAGMSKLRTRPNIPVETLPPFTRAEILALYMQMRSADTDSSGEAEAPT